MKTEEIFEELRKRVNACKDIPDVFTLDNSQHPTVEVFPRAAIMKILQGLEDEIRSREILVDGKLE